MRAYDSLASGEFYPRTTSRKCLSAECVRTIVVHAAVKDAAGGFVVANAFRLNACLRFNTLMIERVGEENLSQMPFG